MVAVTPGSSGSPSFRASASPTRWAPSGRPCVSPAEAWASLDPQPPVLHVYGQPADPEEAVEVLGRPIGQGARAVGGVAGRGAEARHGVEGADAGWELGSLKPRESKTIRVSGRAEKQGELGTCLFASYRPSLCAAVNVVNPQIRLE